MLFKFNLALCISVATLCCGCKDVERRGGTVAHPNPKPLDSAAIWKELFPAEHHFDEQSRLKRTVVRGGDELKLRSEIGKIYRYTDRGASKAVVVIHSYDLSTGKEPVCASCYPQMEVAHFSWKAGAWRKERLEQNWSGAIGAWGKPAEITIDSSITGKEIVLKVVGGKNGDSVIRERSFTLDDLIELKETTCNCDDLP